MSTTTQNKKITDTKVSFDYIYEDSLKQVEEKTKIPRQGIYAVLGCALISFLIGKYEILFTYGITMPFPIKWSYDDYQIDDEDFVKMWGSYWGIFSMFIVLDLIHPFLIKYIPLYFFIRTIVGLWLYLPCFKGAIHFYNVVLVELLKLSDLFRSKYNEKDSMLFELKDKMKLKKE